MDRPPERSAAGAGPGPSSAAAAAAEGLQATLRLLRKRLEEYDTDRARSRLGAAVVRGATAGLALRGGLHLVSYLLGLALARRGKAGAAAVARSDRPGVLELLRDTLRWGAFLGSFAGVYVFSDEAIALLGGRRRWVGLGGPGAARACCRPAGCALAAWLHEAAGAPNTSSSLLYNLHPASPHMRSPSRAAAAPRPGGRSPRGRPPAPRCS